MHDDTETTSTSDTMHSFDDQGICGHCGAFDWTQVRSDTRLREVWDLVKPEGNWKDPIDAIVPPNLATAVEINRAVLFFAGGEPNIRSGQGGCYVVTGAGYYSWIGA